jgi:hypothetical protein
MDQNIRLDADPSIKDILLRLVEWKNYFLGRWKLILLFSLIGAGLGITAAIIKKPSYVAELTFVMESGSNNNGLGAYLGLASQFGIDVGGNSSGIFEGDNIIEFLKSKLMIEKALLSTIRVKNKDYTLAQWYLTFNGYTDSWSKDPILKNFVFPVSLNPDSLSRIQDSVMTTLHNKMLKQHLVVDKVDKKIGFYTVGCLSRDEIFSKVFVERLVKEATEFYINTKTKRAKENVDRLQEQADNMERQLDKKTYAAATIQDINANPARQMAGVPLELATRDKIVLQTMYGEIVKNLELSKISMAQETPIIQVIDTPRLPLEIKNLGKLKGGAIGALAAGFFIVAYLIVRRVLQSILNS